MQSNKFACCLSLKTRIQTILDRIILFFLKHKLCKFAEASKSLHAVRFSRCPFYIYQLSKNTHLATREFPTISTRGYATWVFIVACGVDVPRTSPTPAQTGREGIQKTVTRMFYELSYNETNCTGACQANQRNQHLSCFQVVIIRHFFFMRMHEIGQCDGS